MKKILLSVLVLSLGVSAAEAGLGKAWFQRLMKSLTSSTAQKYASRAGGMTTVAAVRGAPLGEQDPADVYWKGSISEQAAKELDKQREAFAAAVKLAIEDKPGEAKKALEKFQKDFPKSALLADAKEAMKQLEEAAPKEDAAAKAEEGAKPCPADKLAEEEGCPADLPPEEGLPAPAKPDIQ